MPPSPRSSPSLGPLVVRALERRRPLLARADTQAFRAFSGLPDGRDGLFIDVYGPGAALIVHEQDAAPTPPEAHAADAAAVLEALAPVGVRAVYLKPFAKDRSRLGGELPPCTTDPTPAAGDPLPDHLLVRELHWTLEVRLHDGLSTGIFIDQRANRGYVHAFCAARLRDTGTPPAVLNTFSYTAAFSVAAAVAGALTTSVDVSPRYLDWGKRNLAHNGIDPALHRTARMDTFEFLRYARRKGLSYDVIILDPPSFAAGSKRKGIPPWSSVADYARLVAEASDVLAPRGVILASTNTRELCRPGRLEREVADGLATRGKRPRPIFLPPTPPDLAAERERFAARAFTID